MLTETFWVYTPLHSTKPGHTVQSYFLIYSFEAWCRLEQCHSLQYPYPFINDYDLHDICRIYIWISKFDPSSHWKKADSWRTEVGHLSKAKHGNAGNGKNARERSGESSPGNVPVPGNVLGTSWESGDFLGFSSFLRFTSARSIWDLTWLHQGGCHGCHGCSLYWDVSKWQENTEENEGLKTSHVSAMRPKFGNHCSAIDFSQVQFEEAVSAVICWRQQNSSDLSEKRSSCASDRSESFNLMKVSSCVVQLWSFRLVYSLWSCIILHYHALSWFMVIMVLIMRDLRS